MTETSPPEEPNSGVCRSCGSDRIQSVERKYGTGSMDYVVFQSDGRIAYDWGEVDEDGEWETVSWQCGSCGMEKDELEQLVIKAQVWYLTHRNERSRG